MFLDAEDGSRNVFANGNIIGNLCSILLEPLKGDNQRTLGYRSSKTFVKLPVT